MSTFVRTGAAALFVLVLSSCTGQHGAPSGNGQQDPLDDTRLLSHTAEGLNPAEAELLAEAQRGARTRMTGAATGAVLGGGLAAGISLWQKEDTETTALAGAGGALAGGVAGYAAGAYVDEANRQAESNQDDLNARIAAVERDIARYDKVNATARQAVVERQEEVDDLNQRYSIGSIKKAEYEAEISSIQKSIDALTSLVAESEANAQLIERDLAAAKGAPQQQNALRERHQALVDENRALQAELANLVGIIDTVPSEVAVPEQPV